MHSLRGSEGFCFFQLVGGSPEIRTRDQRIKRSFLWTLLDKLNNYKSLVLLDHASVLVRVDSVTFPGVACQLVHRLVHSYTNGLTL